MIVAVTNRLYSGLVADVPRKNLPRLAEPESEFRILMTLNTPGHIPPDARRMVSGFPLTQMEQLGYGSKGLRDLIRRCEFSSFSPVDTKTRADRAIPPPETIDGFLQANKGDRNSPLAARMLITRGALKKKKKKKKARKRKRPERLRCLINKSFDPAKGVSCVLAQPAV